MIPRHTSTVCTRTICSPSTTSHLGPLSATDSSHVNFPWPRLRCCTYFAVSCSSSLPLWLVTRLRTLNSFVSTCGKSYSSPHTQRIVEASLLPTSTQGLCRTSIILHHLHLEEPLRPSPSKRARIRELRTFGGLQQQQSREKQWCCFKDEQEVERHTLCLDRNTISLLYLISCSSWEGFQK